MSGAEDNVTLKGGPFNTVAVPRPNGRSLLVFGSLKDEGARYRQGREKNTFTYRGMEVVTVSLPAPEVPA